MPEVSFYIELLHLGEAWEIKKVWLARERSEVHIYIKYTGKKALCPLSGEMCRIHSHIKERTWRHIDTMQYMTWLHCSVPRVMNKAHKVTTIEVPWADYSKRYTHSFAAAVTALMYRNKNKTKTAAIFRTTIRVIYAIMKSTEFRDVKDCNATIHVDEISTEEPCLMKNGTDQQFSMMDTYLPIKQSRSYEVLY